MKISISKKAEGCIEKCQELAMASEKQGKSAPERVKQFRECVLICNLEHSE